MCIIMMITGSSPAPNEASPRPAARGRRASVRRQAPICVMNIINIINSIDIYMFSIVIIIIMISSSSSSSSSSSNMLMMLLIIIGQTPGAQPASVDQGDDAAI